nr:alpha/beta hydrolase [Acidovorax sp. 106]
MAMNAMALSLRQRTVKASLVLAFFACAVTGLHGCAAPQSPAETVEGQGAVRFTPLRLSVGEDPTQALWALQRGPLALPLRYRVVVIPGSGCAGMGPLADRYFRGLLHAQVTVLHKPGVHPQDTSAPADCPSHFVQSDSLSHWAAHARVALDQIVAIQPPASVGAAPPPLLLVGISEGAELLPALAAVAGPDLAGVVMISSSGLDPREAGRLQALRTGHGADWDALGRMQASTASDSSVHQGRSLRYWRDLWRWPVQQPLIDGPWPLLQVWGERDELVPAAAYGQFAQAAQRRAAPYCARSLPGADHGLQAPGADGVQQVLQWVQQWGRSPGAGLCASLALH